MAEMQTMTLEKLAELMKSVADDERVARGERNMARLNYWLTNRAIDLAAKIDKLEATVGMLSDAVEKIVGAITAAQQGAQPEPPPEPPAPPVVAPKRRVVVPPTTTTPVVPPPNGQTPEEKQ